MTAERGTRLHEHANIIFPDGTTDDGSIWQLDNGTVYAEVDEMWYAIDVTMDVPNWHLKDDGTGQPVLQGLAPKLDTP